MERADRYYYPAILTFEDEQISINYPDLPGCVSVAASEDEVIPRAREALGGHLSVMEDFGEPLPKPTSLSEIVLEQGERSMIVEVYMPLFREAVDTKAVNKTITLPRYMARWAEDHSIKLSAITQAAISSLIQEAESSS